MDLTDLWQQHKKLILTVAGCLLLLLVGGGILSGKYPVEEVERSVVKINANLKKQSEVKSSQVSDLRAEVEALRARCTELAAAMNFRPDEIFVLPASEPNPTGFCWETLRSLQQVLVDEAQRQDITIPEKLGLQDAAPTDQGEIQRTLRALDVIHNVVRAGLDAGVREIRSIRIEPESRGRTKGESFVRELRVEFEVLGFEPSLRRVVATLVEAPRHGEAPFLEIVAPTEVRPEKTGSGLLEMRLTVAGLTLSTEDLGGESS